MRAVIADSDTTVNSTAAPAVETPDARAAGTMNVRIVVSAHTCRKPIVRSRSMPGASAAPPRTSSDLPSGHSLHAGRRPETRARTRSQVTAVRMPLASSARPIPPSAARPGSRNDATRPPAATDICRMPSAAPRRSAGNPWNTEIVPATGSASPRCPEQEQADRERGDARRVAADREQRPGRDAADHERQARPEAVDHDSRRRRARRRCRPRSPR